ncbi:hypothetical protein [Geobacter sp. AOG2]|uniref:hypothetical protein n=1 Tax=Geobacter sp. AOG2 TaxID=1566347 RepID=UPI001CC48673|nr:hypothetical protein [Geobacter sp. AOG2]GFE61198.1 hypothetical protein AOG2_17850 [Geobacter sp. AOG2]
MKLIIATVVIVFTAVVFGIYNRRWATACAFFVLHIALGGFVIGCMSHWASEHRHVASPTMLYNETGMHASVMKPLIVIRG